MYGSESTHALSQFAISGSRLAATKGLLANSHADLAGVLTSLLENSSAEIDALAVAYVEKHGRDRVAVAAARDLQLPQTELSDACASYFRTRVSQEPLLSGSEAVAIVLARHEVEYAVAYAGTSELALCDAIAVSPSPKLINGRGDRESVFIAAGAALCRPGSAVAILHGARGLTNALGAIATVRRNEIGILCIVGMPSTKSAPYLPPHGEPGLIEHAGRFAKASFEIPVCLGLQPDATPDLADPAAFVAAIDRALATALALPAGPVLLGVPEDYWKHRWVPTGAAIQGPVHQPVSPAFPAAEIAQAARLIRGANSPVLFVDDVLFRKPINKALLAQLSVAIQAPVLQVGYRRGPMLFERITSASSPYVIGPYQPKDPAHLALLHDSDLLVTIEDRNMYERVVGRLPHCPKLVITSNGKATRKNGYIEPSDIVIEADAEAVLSELCAIFADRPLQSRSQSTQAMCAGLRESANGRPRISPAYEPFRRGVTRVLGQALSKVKDPLLVDDSQMFGGLISETYENLPSGLRVFGDHSGFVGAGIGFAVGAALHRGEHGVWCTIGDQGFGNGFQSLVCAGELQIPIVLLLCNNGGSVSLMKQSRANRAALIGEDTSGFLRNASNLDNCKLADSLGIQSVRIDLTQESAAGASRALDELARALACAVSHKGPTLIELISPAAPEAWTGIWEKKGLDQSAGKPGI